MAGEDPYDYGVICWDFRKKCVTCGKQVEFRGGQRVEPDCGHPQPGIVVDCDEVSRGE